MAPARAERSRALFARSLPGATLRGAIALAIASASLIAPSRSLAQPGQDSSPDGLATTEATAPLEAQLAGAHTPSPWAQRIAAADLRRIELERNQAWTLFAWGAVNVAQGAALSLGAALAPGPGGERTLGYGVMTASWGAVNVALSLPWLVRLRREHEQRARWSGLSREDLERASDEASDDASRGAAYFALNTGLDVAYIAAGSLMLYMGERPETRNEWVSGMGIAVLMQGAALLAFDAWGWAARDADRARVRAARAAR